MASQARTAQTGPAIGELHEVRGIFRIRSNAGGDWAFDRIGLRSGGSLRTGGRRTGGGVRRRNPERCRPIPKRCAPGTHVAYQHCRGDGALAGAGSPSRLAARAPAVAAAAVAAGAAAGGATFAVSSAANDQEQAELDMRASMGRLMLSVRTPTAAKRSEAEAILRGCATDHRRLTDFIPAVVAVSLLYHIARRSPRVITAGGMTSCSGQRVVVAGCAGHDTGRVVVVVESHGFLREAFERGKSATLSACRCRQCATIKNEGPRWQRTKSINELLLSFMQDIYYAERQILKACRRWQRPPRTRSYSRR